MSLPKIAQPLFDLTVPSTGKKVKFRPFTVKEEKLLLMVGMDTPNPRDVAEVYKQLINNCFLNNIEVDDLTAFDLEYMFLALRSKSVSNVSKVKVKDEDGFEYDVEINLDNAKVENPITKPKVIDLNDEIKAQLQYPSFETLFAVAGVKDQSAATNLLCSACIKSLIEGDKVYALKDYSAEEIENWTEGLSFKNKSDIKDFFEAMPRVSVEYSYTRKDGTEVKKKVTGLQSFFS